MAHPGYGVTVAYHGGERGEATVYVYNKGQQDIADWTIVGNGTGGVRPGDGRSLAGGTIDRQKDRACQPIWAGSPERGKEFLCSEIIVSDDLGTQRTFLYLSGASGSFVKIRVTLRTNDETDATARNFADSVARGLWKK